VGVRCNLSDQSLFLVTPRRGFSTNQVTNREAIRPVDGNGNKRGIQCGERAVLKHRGSKTVEREARKARTPRIAGQAGSPWGKKVQIEKERHTNGPAHSGDFEGGVQIIVTDQVDGRMLATEVFELHFLFIRIGNRVSRHEDKKLWEQKDGLGTRISWVKRQWSTANAVRCTLAAAWSTVVTRALGLFLHTCRPCSTPFQHASQLVQGKKGWTLDSKPGANWKRRRAGFLPVVTLALERCHDSDLNSSAREGQTFDQQPLTFSHLARDG